MGLLRTLLLLLLLQWVPAHAGVLELSQARVTTTINGAIAIADVQLPYHWDLFHKGQRGEATIELDFDLPELPSEPWGLYTPRIGNAYEISLNGTVLQQQGDLVHYNGADYSQAPRYFSIPPSLLQRSNRIQARIRADLGRRGGLAVLTMGPQNDVEDLYQSSYRWRHTGTLLVATFSLLVGVLALALWATQADATGQHQRDPLYLFAALAELSWVVGVGYALLESPPLPWPWWGLIPVAATTSWMCFMLLFCIEVADWGTAVGARWYRRWLVAFAVSMVAAAFWAIGGGQPLALTVMYGVSIVNSLVFGGLFIWRAAGGATLGHRLVAIAIFVNVLLGIRDLYIYRIHPVLGEVTWIRYGSVLFGLSLGYIVILRFRAASAQARNLLATMASRIAQKEAELGDSYRKLEALAREQERSAERTRILRDMHDGVGSHISSAIRQLQLGQGMENRGGRDEVLLTLRDALDQLKLSIDAMNLPPGDITALLANLRYRLEPRLAASGIALQWDVDLLPVVARLDAGAMRQLQFMLFEALSNVVQHAHAKTLCIEAHAEMVAMAGGGQVVLVRVVDDGVGFDVQNAHKKGLASMYERAAAIGAKFEVVSEPGRTAVEIRFS